MSLIGTVLGWILTVFLVVMIVRMVVDWLAVARRGPLWVGRVRALAHAGTEPVVSPVRRLLPPLRAGGLGIDLAFTVVFILVLVLRTVAFNL